MEGERTAPAFWTAGLLFAAAALAGYVGRSPAAAGDRRLRRAGAALALVFVVSGVDELLAVHEPYERALRSPGGAAQLALLAGLAVAGVAWLVVLHRLRRDRTAAGLWLAAPAGWLCAVAVDQRRLSAPKRYASILEDAFELAGSSFFVLALVLVARAGLAAPPPPGPEAAARRARRSGD